MVGVVGQRAWHYIIVTWGVRASCDLNCHWRTFRTLEVDNLFLLFQSFSHTVMHVSVQIAQSHLTEAWLHASRSAAVNLPPSNHQTRCVCGPQAIIPLYPVFCSFHIRSLIISLSSTLNQCYFYCSFLSKFAHPWALNESRVLCTALSFSDRKALSQRADLLGPQSLVLESYSSTKSSFGNA